MVPNFGWAFWGEGGGKGWLAGGFFSVEYGGKRSKSLMTRGKAETGRGRLPKQHTRLHHRDWTAY